MKFRSCLLFLLTLGLLPASPLAAQFSCDESSDYCTCHPGMPPCMPVSNPDQTGLNPTTSQEASLQPIMNLGTTPEADQYLIANAKSTDLQGSTENRNDENINDISQVLPEAVSRYRANTSNNTTDPAFITAKTIISAAPGSYSPEVTNTKRSVKPVSEITSAKNLLIRGKIQKNLENLEQPAEEAGQLFGDSPNPEKLPDGPPKRMRITPNP